MALVRVRHVKNMIEEVCRVLKLGEIIEANENHEQGQNGKVHLVKTTRGVWIVKLIKKQDMSKEVLKTLNISSWASRKMNAVAAEKLGGLTTNLIGDTYVQVFKYLEGLRVDNMNITQEQAFELGRNLSILHNMDYASLDVPVYKMEMDREYDWREAICAGYEKKLGWADVINKEREWIIKLYGRGVRKYNSICVDNRGLTHNDIHKGNIIWQGKSPYILDWDNSYVRNVYIEFMDVGIKMFIRELDGRKVLNKEKFLAYCKGYKANTAQGINWEDIAEAVIAMHLNFAKKRIETSLKNGLKSEYISQRINLSFHNARYIYNQMDAAIEMLRVISL